MPSCLLPYVDKLKYNYLIKPTLIKYLDVPAILAFCVKPPPVASCMQMSQICSRKLEYKSQHHPLAPPIPIPPPPKIGNRGLDQAGGGG